MSVRFQFMYLDISLLVLRAGYGVWLYQFLIIVYLFTSKRILIDWHFDVWPTSFDKTDKQDQELIQSDPISCPQNQRERIKYINWQQFTKGTHGKPNEQLFPRQVVIRELPKLN